MRRIGRRAALLAGAAFLIILSRSAQPEESLPAGGLLNSPFGAHLADRLAGDGFDRKQVEQWIADPRTAVNKTTLSYAIVYRETAADYSQFLSERRLARAHAFLEKQRVLLEEAQQAYQVPPEITAAILMVESDFGNFRKLHRVFNVFTTLLWADRPENFDTVRGIIQRRLPEVEPEKIQKRSQAKAAWGYEQLQYLLRIATREGLDPLAIEGSWAGAFGLPQFIPSSYWDYAVDGNGDQRVRLYNEADAIFSIGNYLKSFGWRRDLPEEKKKAVLRRYNNSGLYVDTILAAADQLGQPRKAQR